MKAIIELKPSLKSLSHAGRKGMKWGKNIFDATKELKENVVKKIPENIRNHIKELAAVKELVDRMDNITKITDSSLMEQKLAEFQRDYATSEEELNYYANLAKLYEIQADPNKIDEAWDLASKVSVLQDKMLEKQVDELPGWWEKLNLGAERDDQVLRVKDFKDSEGNMVVANRLAAQPLQRRTISSLYDLRERNRKRLKQKR